MVSKGPFAIPACRYGLASPVFGEAVIMMVPSCKHDESQSRTSERRVGRSGMPGLNVRTLRKCEDNLHFFTIYKASARHPELRNILRRRGIAREFIEFCAGRQRDTRLGDRTRTTLCGIGTISGDLPSTSENTQRKFKSGRALAVPDLFCRACRELLSLLQGFCTW